MHNKAVRGGKFYFMLVSFTSRQKHNIFLCNTIFLHLYMRDVIMIEKNAVFGELLYMGLVYEKGRCKSNGLWKHGYSKSLKKHINLLKEIVICMQNEFEKEEDNIFLRNIYNEVYCDNVLKKVYAFNESSDKLIMKRFIITDCSDENKHLDVIVLIHKLLEEVSLELDKGLRKDKKKISRLLFSLHNLPRVFLNKEADTLYSLGNAGIEVDDAIRYARMSMDKELLCKYKKFFEIKIK